MLSRILQMNPAKMDLLVHFLKLCPSIKKKKKLQNQIAKLEPKEVMRMRKYTNSWREEGRIEGRRQGRIEGQANLLAFMVRERFGSVPSELEKQFMKLPPQKIQRLSGQLLKTSSLSEFQLLCSIKK